ncbi:hypothetical protein DNU06_04425 [Putridiphycobacter roseus]|uniref:Uncharacterized protein n=1 Tax=Putridiphycobacter roseus TaxID=2219161 RepID=A0A2W1N037_9FLAO|nr:hypothetical protein [Putridiphycobacter roseus]PZE17869.1 hypothetical protein DNU06_04425 [Putridiphycobacter roseus]
MKKSMKKYFIMQIVIGFVLAFFVLGILYGGESKRHQDAVWIIALMGSFVYALLNAVIHLFNFSYVKSQNKLLAFVLPIIVWTIFLNFALYLLAISYGLSASDWSLLIIFIEPIVYNLLLLRLFTKS